MKNGTVVISLAGHDKGKLYVVVSVKEENVFICDGKTKLLSKPKKKKQKHIADTGEYIDFSLYKPLYDAHIKKELACLIKKGGCCLG